MTTVDFPDKGAQSPLYPAFSWKTSVATLVALGLLAGGIWWFLGTLSRNGEPPILTSWKEGALQVNQWIQDRRSGEPRWQVALWWAAVCSAVIAGLLWLWRARKPGGTAWGMALALSLATFGNLDFWNRHFDGKALHWWGGAALAGVLAVRLGNREERDLLPARRRHYFLPILFSALLITPLSSLSLRTIPPNFPPWNQHVANAAMAWTEIPGYQGPGWAWTEGTIIDSWKSPLHMWPIFWWTGEMGVSITSLRAYSIAAFLLVSVLLFWGLEGLAGTPMALGTLLITGVSCWSLSAARMITYVPMVVLYCSLFLVVTGWAFRGRSWYRWLAMGAVWGACPYYYAPGRLLGLSVGLWFVWELFREQGRRLRLCGGFLIALAVASLGYTPNILFPEEFRVNLGQFRGEQVYKMTTDSHWMQQWLGKGVLPPYSNEQRIRGGLINLKNNALEIPNFLTGTSHGTESILNPGLALLGLALAFFGGKNRWRRWLLSWLVVAILCPAVAVNLYLERMVFFIPLAAWCLSIPFGLAAGALRRSRWPERIVCGLILAVLFTGAALAEATKSLSTFTGPRSPVFPLADFVNSCPNPPVYMLEESRVENMDVLQVETYNRRRELGPGGLFQWVAPQAAAEFLKDAAAWGFGGTVVAAPHVFREQPDALPQSQERVAHWTVLPLENLTGVPAIPWKIWSASGIQAAQCYRCRFPEHEYLSPRVFLWGPGTGTVLESDEELARVFYEPEFEATGPVLAVLQVQYCMRWPLMGPYPPIEVWVDGSYAGGFLPEGLFEEGRLSPVIFLGELAPGRHGLQLTYQGLNQDQRMVLWDVTIRYLQK